MARLLITGASGLLGANLVIEASKHHDVIAISRGWSLDVPGVTNLNIDITIDGELGRIFEANKPDWVVHCAAMTDVDTCERNPDKAMAINCELPSKLASASYSYGANLIHISTDAVFNGQGGPYSEDDTPNPINAYGVSKAAGERAVLENHPAGIILRTNFFGWNAQPKKSLAEWFLHGLQKGEIRWGFKDVKVGLLFVNDLCEWILNLFEAQIHGTYNLVSQDCISKFEFGCLVARVFGLDENLIRPISVERANLVTLRPKNLCLKTNKIAQVMKMQPPTIAAGITRFKSLYDQIYPKLLKETLIPISDSFTI